MCVRVMYFSFLYVLSDKYCTENLKLQQSLACYDVTYCISAPHIQKFSNGQLTIFCLNCFTGSANSLLAFAGPTTLRASFVCHDFNGVYLQRENRQKNLTLTNLIK